MTRTEWATNMMRDTHWREVLDELRTAEMAKFAASEPTDIDSREDAYRMVRCLNQVQSHIESLAMSATIKERRWKIL